MKQREVYFVAWIALSPAGHPAPMLGFAFSRKQLRLDYRARFGGHSLELDGYSALKVHIREAR